MNKCYPLAMMVVIVIIAMTTMMTITTIMIMSLNFYQVDGILAVHEFHIWQLAGDRIIASAHVRNFLFSILFLDKCT